MNPALTRSVLTLMLASVLLATGTLLFSIAIGPQPGWPAIMHQPRQPAGPPVAPPANYPETIDQAPIDHNLRKLWQLLQDEAKDPNLKFPPQVEEAMQGEATGQSVSLPTKTVSQ